MNKYIFRANCLFFILVKLNKRSQKVHNEHSYIRCITAYFSANRLDRSLAKRSRPSLQKMEGAS